MIIKIAKKILRRISRFFNKFAYRKCVPYAKVQRKSISMIGGTDTIYFDPYLLKDESNLYMYVSNRTDSSIDRFQIVGSKKVDSGIKCLSAKPNTWQDIVNRGCVIKHNSKFLMYYTGQQFKNSFIGLAMSDDGVTWCSNLDPIMKPECDFEGNSIMNPCVLKKNNQFIMLYSAGEQYEPDVICRATSADGVTWIKDLQPVFLKGSNSYDSYKVGGCDVHVINNLFYMFYIGYFNLDSACICLALSKDGVNWKRSSINPLIIPSKKGWDSDSVYKPAVCFDENKKIIYIYYNGRKKHYEAIGCAKIFYDDFFNDIKKDLEEL